MTDLNNSYRLLYKQALIDPSVLSEEDILGLLVKYPYSQPLIFSYERRKKILGESSANKDMALLYAQDSNWLWNFVNKPLQVIEEVTPVNEEYVPFEQWDTQVSSEGEEIQEGVTNEAVEEIQEEHIDISQDEIELDKLALEGGIVGDYFIFDQKEGQSTGDLDSETVVDTENEEEKEDVSLYNDDLMPYSFRWWLQKTRLEYAGTYQPYAVPNLTKKANHSQDVFKKIAENILDQQIKENIINFQDPEMKLSEEVKQKPVVAIEPKKSDEIIERFIKEEPIIQAPSAENLNNENMARQSAEDNYVLVTETLANIYVDQALYLKAIEVFRKLILKYPEKKSYFATRIQELEKNI